MNRKHLIILTLATVTIVTATACRNKTTTKLIDGGRNASVTLESSQVEQSVGDNVVIHKNEITKEAQFFPFQAGDTAMELLAFKASDGTIRTAFNTCAVCYDSGRGYYIQQGDVLVCQNCGNQFPADRVGIEIGGCNPIPIMGENRSENEETITIASDYILQHKGYFAKWHK